MNFNNRRRLSKFADRCRNYGRRCPGTKLPGNAGRQVWEDKIARRQQFSPDENTSRPSSVVGAGRNQPGMRWTFPITPKQRVVSEMTVSVSMDKDTNHLSYIEEASARSNRIAYHEDFRSIHGTIIQYPVIIAGFSLHCNRHSTC